MHWKDADPEENHMVHNILQPSGPLWQLTGGTMKEGENDVNCVIPNMIRPEASSGHWKSLRLTVLGKFIIALVI